MERKRILRRAAAPLPMAAALAGPLAVPVSRISADAPSYKHPFRNMGSMDLTEIRSSVFRADDVYCVKLCNARVLGSGQSAS